MAETIRLGVTVDTDTRATRKEFADLRREVKREAEDMGGDWEAAALKIEESLREAGARDDLIEAARRIGTDGPTEIEKMQRALRDLETESKTAGDTMEAELERPIEPDIDTEGPLTKTQDMVNEVRASLGETLGELSSTLAEGGASMEDMVDGIVEVSAEAAGALPGPWGLAGQALVAVGSAVYGSWKKRMEDIAEDASAMYQDMLDSGSEYLSNDFFQKKLGEFFDPMGESYDSNMDKIDLLGTLGVPMDEAARALVGYGDLSDEVYQKLMDQTYGASVATFGLGAGYDALGIGSRDVMAGIIKDLEDSRTSTREAQTAVRRYRDSIDELPSEKDTEVDVDDNGTIRDTQRKINDIHGGEATIRVRADTSSVFEGIAAAVAHAGRQTATIPVTARRVGGFYA